MYLENSVYYNAAWFSLCYWIIEHHCQQ